MEQERRPMRHLVLSLGAVAVILLVMPGLIRWGMYRTLDLGTDQATDVTRLLGHVVSGQFVDLNPFSSLSGRRGMTTIAMQEARPPSSAPLDLTAYEGHLVTVTGRDSSGWLYQASVERDLGDGLAASIAIWAWQR